MHNLYNSECSALNSANTISIPARRQRPSSVPRLPAGLQATLTLSSKPGGALLPLLLLLTVQQPSSKKPRDVQTAGADEGVAMPLDDAGVAAATATAAAVRVQPMRG